MRPAVPDEEPMTADGCDANFVSILVSWDFYWQKWCIVIQDSKVSGVPLVLIVQALSLVLRQYYLFVLSSVGRT